MIIRASICVSDIDKSRITTSEKNGKKYLNLVLMDYKQGQQYGNDGSVAHDVSQEERQAGTKGAFCGNWKWVYKPEGMAAPAPAAPAPPVAKPAAVPVEDDDSIPF